MNININYPKYLNILFLFCIKSIAPIISLSALFTAEQVNQYLVISSYMQLFFFVWFLGQTSVLSYNIRSAFDIYSIFRLSLFFILLLFMGVNAIDALIAATFSFVLGFNSFTDLRMKYFDINLSSLKSYVMLIPVIALYVSITIRSEHARLLLQIGLASIFFIPVFFKLHTYSLEYGKKANYYVILYSAITSVFTFFERQLFADMGNEAQYFAFLGINVCIFIIFFADFWAKRSTARVEFFKIFHFLTSIATLSIIILNTEFFYFVAVIQIAITQFLTFSMYVVYRQAKIIIINILFIGLYDVLFSLVFLNILQIPIYYIIYCISFFHGLILFNGHKNKHNFIFYHSMKKQQNGKYQT